MSSIRFALARQPQVSESSDGYEIAQVPERTGRKGCHESEGYHRPSWYTQGNDATVRIHSVATNSERCGCRTRADHCRGLSPYITTSPTQYRFRQFPASRGVRRTSTPTRRSVRRTSTRRFPASFPNRPARARPIVTDTPPRPRTEDEQTERYPPRTAPGVGQT